MCNLYNMTPKEDLQVYFRALYPAIYEPRAVGPFGAGAFVRPDGDGVAVVLGQWGMIGPKSRERRPSSRAILTNNARLEGVRERPTYRDAWAQGRRCLIPAVWYQEPNWESGKHIPWRLRRADGAPWAIAGLWSEWTDPASGEIVPNYTMITVNCDAHPMLSRLHKPDPKLPDHAQDKRSLVHVQPDNWAAWLHGAESDAAALLVPAPVEMFDTADALHTDWVLAGMHPALL